VGAEHGRLDVLVNNVWGGYEGHEHEQFNAPFWEQPARHWEAMFTAGLRAHLTAARLAVPLMPPRRGGLIVTTTAWDRGKYLGNLYYDVAKAAVNRMAFGLACELRSHGIAAVALAPGFMRTERVLAAHAATPFDLGGTESPEYIGRAVAALASDPELLRKSGDVLAVGDLAAEYGFTDIDGRTVPPFAIPDGFYRRYE
jgi:NAD(P)-dependent dehydrogenase (short-subunit alcohol dehydrogenase family)